MTTPIHVIKSSVAAELRETAELIVDNHPEQHCNQSRQDAVFETLVEIVVKRCIDMMPVCPAQLSIKDAFGLDSPELRKAAFAATLVAERKANPWKLVPEADWLRIFCLAEDYEPLDTSDSGTHCYHNDYHIDEFVYRITQEWHDDDIIEIEVRLLREREIT